MMPGVRGAEFIGGGGPGFAAHPGTWLYRNEGRQMKDVNGRFLDSSGFPEQIFLQKHNEMLSVSELWEPMAWCRLSSHPLP